MDNSKTIVLFLLVYIAIEVAIMGHMYGLNTALSVAGSALLFIVATRCLVKDDSEDYKEPVDRPFEPSLRSVCKGGPWMWQTDTPLAKACRDLYATDPKSIRNPDQTYMMGAKPYAPFEFDPIINDNFEMVRCSNKNQ